MFIFSVVYKIFIDSLFPISKAEQELFLLQPEQSYEKLKPAPSYDGLAVPLSNIQSIFAYKDKYVEKLIWNIKYKKSEHAIKIGGYALYQKIISHTENGLCSNLSKNHPLPILIIPMPITNRRRKERGYNQCELLIDEIEKLIKNNTNPQQFIIEKNLLIRTHHNSRQTLKDRAERLESAKGIFGIDEKIIEELNKQIKNISEITTGDIPTIIIDDVITTGSTMYEAIKTLEKNGFKNTIGLSLAH